MWAAVVRGEPKGQKLLPFCLPFRLRDAGAETW